MSCISKLLEVKFELKTDRFGYEFINFGPSENSRLVAQLAKRQVLPGGKSTLINQAELGGKLFVKAKRFFVYQDTQAMATFDPGHCSAHLNNIGCAFGGLSCTKSKDQFRPAESLNI